jgi:amino acid permease
MKKIDRKSSTISRFMSGILFASIVMFCVGMAPTKAHADINCMRNNLTAWGYANTIPSPLMSIVYTIPDCIRSYGYTIESVSIYNGMNGMVRVNYASTAKSGTGIKSNSSGSNAINAF